MSAFNMLVKKDLIQYFSNRRAVLVNIVLPIVIGAFFGYVFGGGGGDTEMATIAVNVVDLDQSAVSKDIIEHLKTEKRLSVAFADAPSADALLKGGKITANLTFPAGFGQDASRALFTGRARPAIKIGVDPSQRLGLEVVRGLLAQDVMQSVTKFAFSNTASVFPDLRQQIDKSDLPESRRHNLKSMFDSIDQVGRDNAASASAAPGAATSAAGAASSPINAGLKLPYDTEEIEATTHADSKYNGYAHSFAGMGVQFILFMGIDIGIALLTMRRMDIWKRLKAAPLSRATLLGSRAASCAIIALIIFSIIMTAAVLVFGVRIEGSLIGLIAILVVFSMMTATFGLMIAALGRSPEATRGLAMMATLVLVMLGGAWVPAFIFPKWLQQISLIAPTRWAVDGIDAMTWRGLGVDSALAPVAVMLGFTVLFGAVALMRFEWDE